MIRAVVFDLGNVLIDWDPAPAIAREVGEQEARRFLDEFDFRGWNHRQDQGLPFEQSEREVIARHPRWSRHVLAYRSNFAESLRGSIEGTVRVLREVRATGIPVYGLTNWAAETFHHARERFDWLELFDDIVVSGEEQVAKPDEEIFHVLARRTGVALEETFFTDDSKQNVATALRLGMYAVRFDSPGQLRAELLTAGVLSAEVSET